jgi:hypothetical protein
MIATAINLKSGSRRDREQIKCQGKNYTHRQIIDKYGLEARGEQYFSP